MWLYFYLRSTAVISLGMIVAFIDNAFYSGKMLVFLFNSALHILTSLKFSSFLLLAKILILFYNQYFSIFQRIRHQACKIKPLFGFFYFLQPRLCFRMLGNKYRTAILIGEY